MRHPVITGQLLRQHRAALDAEADVHQAEDRVDADARANRLRTLVVSLARRAAPWRPAPGAVAGRPPA